jgi:hypothetical protein
MKIPETLKVGPFPYRVERPALVNNERRDRVGEADNANLVIRIEAGLVPERSEEVFFHEMVHVADVFMGVGLNEEQVERLSVGLYMVLKENNLLRDG